LLGLTEEKLNERDERLAEKLRGEFKKRGSKDSVRSDPAHITDELKDQMAGEDPVQAGMRAVSF
jgi:hypothetical protein